MGSSNAIAQSSLTLYGLLDLSLDATHASSQTTYRILSGAQTGSRFGIRGMEDLGAGNHINFALENGFNLASGQASDTSSAFNRQAWVGLSGHWGEVRLGRQNSPLYVPLEGKFDASGTSTIASGLNSFATLSVRASNGIYYQTPTFMGLTAQALVSLRDSTTAPSNGVNSYHLTLSYVSGPIDAGAGYQRVDNYSSTNILRAGFIGGSYRFGNVKAYLGFHNARLSDGTINKNVYTASTSYAFSPATSVALVYSILSDHTTQDHDANHIGVMINYFLSVRTWVYASAAHLINKGTSRYALVASTTAGVPVPYAGADATGIELGLQHRF